MTKYIVKKNGQAASVKTYSGQSAEFQSMDDAYHAIYEQESEERSNGTFKPHQYDVEEFDTDARFLEWCKQLMRQTYLHRDVDGFCELNGGNRTYLWFGVHGKETFFLYDTESQEDFLAKYDAFVAELESVSEPEPETPTGTEG